MELLPEGLGRNSQKDRKSHEMLLTSITHVNTNSIVLWVILPSNADWDCFETLILQETLKTRSQHQEEFCAFSEVDVLWVGFCLVLSVCIFPA